MKLSRIDDFQILVKYWRGDRESRDYPDFDEVNTALYNVGKDLERLEKIEENYYSLNISCEEIEFENVRLEEENKKLKQAIDILKDKIEVIWQDEDLYLLKLNDYKKTETIKLTGKEYELLKEVLEDE
jgi:predicted nuclease with TOPRIM domain